MAKDPITSRRLARRLAVWGQSNDPQKGAELRDAYRQHISALENGRGSMTDAERRDELAQAKNDYGRLVNLAPIEDPSLPMGSTDVGNIIQKANPVINTFAKGSTPGIGETPKVNSSSPVVTPSGNVTSRASVRAARRAGVAGAGVSTSGATTIPSGLLPTGETNPYPTVGTANYDPLQPKVTSGLSPTITPSKSLSVPTASVDTASSGGGKFGLNADTLNMAGSAASLLFGVLGASKPLPKYAMPAEWEMLGSRLKTMSQQGLSPESQALAKNQLATNFNTTLAQTRGLTGGGGSSSEAAANAIDASSRFGPQYLQMAVANQDAQRANMGPYIDHLRTNLSIDQQGFSRDYNQAANAQNNYATLASQSLQQLQQAPYEHQNDGLWKEYMDGMLQDRARTRLAIQKKTELANR